MTTRCPACRESSLIEVFDRPGVPAQTAVLFDSPADSLAVPRGDMQLVACLHCGLFFNAGFEPSLCRYDGSYEETQAYSPAFMEYLRQLAADLTDRLDLHGARLLEVGCGKGEFLSLMCKQGNNTGTGYDPAFRQDRHPAPALGNLHFEPGNFTRDSPMEQWDLVVNRMTLEHVPDVHDFLATLALAMQGKPGCQLFTQVPNCALIFERGLLCDLLYEHCNYFVPDSLPTIMSAAGLSVTETTTGFGGQHLSILAHYSGDKLAAGAHSDRETQASARKLRSGVAEHLDRWNARLDAIRRQHERAVLWGSGSKATAFLDYHHSDAAIQAVVDINPHRQGSYVAGTATPVIAPAQLLGDGPWAYPDVVVLMNPYYEAEIKTMLKSLSLNPRILTL